jgi:hypothetical protein
VPEVPKVRAPSPNVQHHKKQNASRSRPTQSLPKRDGWQATKHVPNIHKCDTRESARPHIYNGTRFTSLGQHTEAKIPWNRTSAPPLSTDPSWNHSGSHASDPSQRSATTRAQEDLSMIKPPPSPSRAKGETQVEIEKLPEEATTPKNKLFFGLLGLNDPHAQKTEANANPFANSDEGSRGVDLRARP